jgi:hypothetical protein
VQTHARQGPKIDGLVSVKFRVENQQHRTIFVPARESRRGSGRGAIDLDSTAVGRVMGVLRNSTVATSGATSVFVLFRAESEAGEEKSARFPAVALLL